ncbi:MAG TPA: hypothetical protein VGD88_08905 [Opitutaceae bacterium]
MFSIATPSEVRVPAVSTSEQPARDVVRIGKLLMAMDSGVSDIARLLDDRPPVPGVVVAPSPNARRPAA